MTDLSAKDNTLIDGGQLQELIQLALDDAKRQGASASEVGVSVDQGLSVTVRKGEVETVEHNRDKGLGITVYFGQCKGSASTTDFSPHAIRETVTAACNIARYTTGDDCNGLADAGLMATEIPDLDLYHPWALSAAGAGEIARVCEAAALATDARITNTEGATVNTHEGVRAYGNSHGFVAFYPRSRHSISCSVIAGSDNEMQSNYWYSVARKHEQLEAASHIGEQAAQRALRRLNAQRLGTMRVPVVFAAEIATGLVSHFMSAINGNSLYRKSSFLLDQLDAKVFPEFVHIHEQPHLLQGNGSAPFDNEGVATAEQDFVTQGRLVSYVLDSYAACRLGMQTTGNAGGAHNLSVDSGPHDQAGLLRQMGRGLLVTDVMGQGINIVTGDYSRGASGFWVENGEIQYPVEEITIAGNLRDMYAQLVEVGNDVDTRGNIRCGSLLLEQMTVAGD